MNAADQASLLELFPCTTCDGTGTVDVDDLDIGLLTTGRCPTCHGASTLDYDPSDTTEIGF